MIFMFKVWEFVGIILFRVYNKILGSYFFFMRFLYVLLGVIRIDDDDNEDDNDNDDDDDEILWKI